MNLSEKDRFV